MRERVGQRLSELRAEFAAGERVLAELEADRVDLEQTLLRISGAIQVLEELMSGGEPPPGVGPGGDLVEATSPV